METKIVKHRLVQEDRETIFNLSEKGVSIHLLAEQFKVSKPTVYSIIEKARKNQTKNEFFIKNNDDNKDFKDMSNLTKITFLGVTIDTENGSSNPKVRKALDKSFQLLDIMKFIKVTKFKLNMTMFDYFWQVVVGNQCIINDLVLEWFGYEGEIKEQYKNFKKMLKVNKISYDENPPKNQENFKIVSMDPRDLKTIILQLKTEKGHKIREYFLDLEELLKLYVEYTLYFNHRESQRKITDLEQMMTQMEVERNHDREIMKSILRDVKNLISENKK